MTTYQAHWPITDDQLTLHTLKTEAGADLPELVDADHAVMMASPSWEIIPATEQHPSPTGLVLQATVTVRVIHGDQGRGFGGVESERMGARNRDAVLQARSALPGATARELGDRLGLSKRTIERHLAATMQAVAS